MALAWLDETGLHLPQYSDVLEHLRGVFRAVYGEEIYLEADSQDGALCAALAACIYDCFTLSQSVYNSYSPATAQGAGLSSVVKTNGIRRRQAGRSYADLRLVGRAGTVIRDGAATDDAGQRWLLPAEVILPLSGEITVTALAADLGEIRAAAGEIKIIATPTRGWQSVANPDAARPGAAVEEDYQLRRRQSASTALPSLSVFDGTAGAIASLDGVARSRGYENDSDAPDANGLPPHSVSFVVDGGDAQAIGDVISLKKGPGCGTHGDVAVQTRDKHGSPKIVSFYRPDIADVGVYVKIRPLAGYYSLTEDVIKANVAAHINGLRIGDDVLLSKLYSPINEAEPVAGQRTFDIVELRIGIAGESLTAANLPMAFNAAPACDAADVEVVSY